MFAAPAASRAMLTSVNNPKPGKSSPGMNLFHILLLYHIHKTHSSCSSDRVPPRAEVDSNFQDQLNNTGFVGMSDLVKQFWKSIRQSLRSLITLTHYYFISKVDLGFTRRPTWLAHFV